MSSAINDISRGCCQFAMDKLCYKYNRKDPMTQFVDTNDNERFGSSESKNIRYEKPQRKRLL